MGQLEQMRVFVRVVESGSITRAADQLGLAKSAVSRRLVDLEQHLGVRLLNRTTRSSSLTAAGREYYERSLKIIDDVDELDTQARDSGAALEGNINLATPLSFGLCHLTGAIDSFLREHPALTINVQFSDRQVDLVEEGMDVAVRITALQDSSLVARHLAPIRLVLCASPGYLKRYGVPTHPEQLSRHRLLRYVVPGVSSWRLTGPDGELHAVPVEPVISSNNGDFLRDMALAAHGIIATPTFIAWQALMGGQLVAVLEQYQLPPLNAYAVYPQRRYLSGRTRALIEFLQTRFGDRPYWDELREK